MILDRGERKIRFMNQKVMVRNLKELERKNKILEEFDEV